MYISIYHIYIYFNFFAQTSAKLVLSFSPSCCTVPGKANSQEAQPVLVHDSCTSDHSAMDALLERLIGTPRRNNSVPSTEPSSVDGMADSQNQETMASTDTNSSGKINDIPQATFRANKHFTHRPQT